MSSSEDFVSLSSIVLSAAPPQVREGKGFFLEGLFYWTQCNVHQLKM